MLCCTTSCVVSLLRLSLFNDMFNYLPIHSVFLPDNMAGMEPVMLSSLSHSEEVQLQSGILQQGEPFNHPRELLSQSLRCGMTEIIQTE